MGGDVPSALSLTIAAGSASFGSFVPATARNYDTALAATVVSTAGDATLSVADPERDRHRAAWSTATFSLPSPLQVRAANAANPNPAFVPLSSTAGSR